MRIIIFAFILFVMTTPIFSQMPRPEPGVSLDLAKWRAANYSNVSYKLDIVLEKGAPLMKGTIEIHVTLTEEGAKNDLILDWRRTPFLNDKEKPYTNVLSINDDQKPLAIEVAEHLRLPHPDLKPGENVIKIEFASPIKASGSAITRYVDKEDNGEYIYSLFVPSDASMAFPVFDQPDLKARFQLKVTAPKDWVVVSNTDQPDVKFHIDSMSGKAVPNRTNGDSNTREWDFFQTKPISTYVFAFAAGDFTTFDESPMPVRSKNSKDKGSIGDPLPETSEELQRMLNELARERPRQTSKIYVRRSQAEKFKAHEKEIFRLKREAVKFLETYFDLKFPFPKYDIVLIPEFPFGGMEHAGATFLRENSVIFPTEPTKNDFASRANVIFHETAHQWFGDTVTMKWFDDLWLKEGFAEFMAYKTMEKVMPDFNAWKIFYERNKQAAYSTDTTRGTTAIYQPIANLSAAKSAYGNIVYRKAPSFLRQAEFYLGPDKFQTAVRAFLKKHAYGNATWQDLVREFEIAGGQDLQQWGNAWVVKRGMPVVREVSSELHEYEEIGKPHDTALVLSLLQKDALGEGGIWPMKTRMFVKYANGRTESKLVEMNKEKTNIGQYWLNIVSNPNFKPDEPVFVFPNYQDYGYGIFLPDDRSRSYILQNIQTEKDDFLRSMMWGALWDSVREGELAPKEYIELVIKNINSEPDESTVQTLLGRVSTAMNYYLSDAQRDALAQRVETFLISRLPVAPTAGLRITYYRAFLNIASTTNSRNTLKNILEESLKDGKGVPDKQPILAFSLKTKDKFDIVTRLAILGDPDAARLLAELVKTETSDDARRYAYAVGAAFDTKEVKAKYFSEFLSNKDVSESWIEAAVGPFNSSRHAALTVPFLERALVELPNLKRTRKIFFVNGWLGAFIGGQKSAEALSVVNKFLDDNPNLDRDLRLKILENVDGLERAVKIRSKFSSNL